jgi:hypothetical protein
MAISLAFCPPVGYELDVRGVVNCEFLATSLSSLSGWVVVAVGRAGSVDALLRS